MAEQGTREIWFSGAFMRTLVSTEESGGSVSTMEHWYPGDWGPPLHVHHDCDQVLHVLEGELITRTGEVDGKLQAGESAFLPRGVAHTFKTGSSGAKVIETNLPGGFERFHVEAGDPAPEARIPDDPTPDVARMEAAIGKYNADFVGPPLP